MTYIIMACLIWAQPSQFQEGASPLSIFLLLLHVVCLQINSDTSPVLFSACGPWWLLLFAWQAKGERLTEDFSFPKYCLCACHNRLTEVTAFWVVIMTSWNVLKFILYLLLSNELMPCIGKEAINRIWMVINSKLLVKLVDFGKDYPFFTIT